MKEIKSEYDVREQLGEKFPKSDDEFNKLPQVRKKPGERQMRHFNASYLNKEEVSEEKFNIETGTC